MTNEEAMALLLELGETKEEVAANLVMLGCKGELTMSPSCPVAVYLRGHGASGVYVGYLSVQVEPTERPRAHLSNAVREFVDAFDEGYFKELRR